MRNKAKLQWVGLIIAAFTVLPIAAFLALWLIYRIPTGPVIEYTTQVKYQMIDFGQSEPDWPRYWIIEPLTGHSRLFLSQGPVPFVYAPNRQVQECWPEPVRIMRELGYTIEVTYHTRHLLFADGTTPADLISIRKVPGTPHVTK